MRCPACTSESVAEGGSCPPRGASPDGTYAEARILPDDSKPRPGHGRKTGRTRAPTQQSLFRHLLPGD